MYEERIRHRLKIAVCLVKSEIKDPSGPTKSYNLARTIFVSFTMYFRIQLCCLFVLRFYGPVNPMGSCRERSVYLTTRLMGRLSPLSIVHILSPETDNCPSWISGRERMTVETISWSVSTKECCRPRLGLNPRPPDLQSDGASNWVSHRGRLQLCCKR